MLFAKSIVSCNVVACARPIRIDYDNAILGHADLNLPLLTWFAGKTLETLYLKGENWTEAFTLEKVDKHCCGFG